MMIGTDQIGHGDLAETFDRGSKEALENFAGNPLAVVRGIWCPQHGGHGAQDTDQVYGAFTILQGNWLPE